MSFEIVQEVVGLRDPLSGPWGIPKYRVKSEDNSGLTDVEVFETNIRRDISEPVTSALIQTSNVEDSEDSDSSEIIVEQNINKENRNIPPAEVFDVNSESDDLDSDNAIEEEEPPVVAHGYQLRRRRSTINPSTSILDENDSSTDEDKCGPKKKSKMGAKKIFNLKTVMKKLKKNPDIIDEYDRCVFYSEANASSLMLEFCRKYGPDLREVKLVSWVWKPINHYFGDVEYAPSNLPVILKYCKNLTSLELGLPPSALDVNEVVDLNINIKNLKKFIYNAETSETEGSDESEAQLKNVLNIIFKEAINLETFYCKVSVREDLRHVLASMLALSEEGHSFKKLTTFKLTSIIDYTPVILHHHEIESFSKIKWSSLRYLYLGVGLWSDITGATFKKMLSSFPKLVELIVEGTFQGELSTGTIIVDFPPLNHLNNLSVGAEYTFSSPIENSMAKNRKVVPIEDEFGLLKLQLKLPMLANLESITLGSLINIDKLTPTYFPKLKCLRIGGPWNLSFDFLAPEIIFPTVIDLQFPDGLKDESFSSRIPALFPNIKKARIYLPSAKCLKSFIREIERSGVPLLEELHLKTQFDFESTLESCLLKSSSILDVVVTAFDKEKIKKINLYKYKDEFIQFYNIELPEEYDSNDTTEYPGIGVFKSLKVLMMEHIPRVIRIPEGEFRWYDPRCKFSGHVVGFDKFPLNKKCLKQLPAKQLENCQWPNFQVEHTDVYILESQGFGRVREAESDSYLTGQSSSWSTSSPRSNSNVLKVRVEPSMLRFVPFKPKCE